MSQSRVTLVAGLLAAMPLLFGCAEAPVTSVAAGKAQAAAPVPNIKLLSMRISTGMKADDCPIGASSWKKDALPNLMAAADACAQYGKNDRLEQIANVIAQRFSNEPWGAFYLSLAALERKEYPRALWMVELAMKKSPHAGLLFYQRGRVHNALGEVGAAADDFRNAVKESPNLVDARLFLAQLSARDQNFKEARNQFEMAVQVEPDNHQAFADLAEVDVRLKQTDAAIAAYEKAVDLSPRNIAYRLRLAYLYETDRKDYAAALSSYKHSVFGP
jgi:tetratricopeptide (TPR) repeat protein